jgi:hypothetical protein
MRREPRGRQGKGMTIPERPDRQDAAAFREDFGRRFIVTVDTEEEFDWDAPIRRDGYGLAAIPALARFQGFCEEFGVIPVYLVDYAVATSPVAAEVLGPPVRAGRAEIGVHLHPWVNPPFDEEVSDANSFAGNLPEELETEKFRQLVAAIRDNLGASPLIYRAGRYGAGPNTAKILKDSHILIDSSVRPRFDYRKGGGPDFANHPLHPYWLDAEHSLLELPLTSVYRGPLRRFGHAIYPGLERAPLCRGVLARLGLLERIPLTPEGVTVREALRGIDTALSKGLGLLVFSFHSPSLAAGHTPYVRSDGDLEAFYDWWRTVFDHLTRRGVTPSSVGEIAAAVSLA